MYFFIYILQVLSIDGIGDWFFSIDWKFIVSETFASANEFTCQGEVDSLKESAAPQRP